MRPHYVTKTEVIVDLITKTGSAVPNQLYTAPANKQHPGYRALLNYFRTDSYNMKELEEKICENDIQEDRVLLIMDTSYYTFESIAGKFDKNDTKIGYINKDSKPGFGFHVGLLVSTTTGLPIGTGAFEFLVRPFGTENLPPEAMPPKIPESEKWFNTAAKVRERIPLSCNLLIVCDREADVYSFFNQVSHIPNADVVVRFAQDRILVENQHRTLKEVLRHLSPQGFYNLEIRAQQGRAARTARLALSYTTIKLAYPKNARKKHGLDAQQTITVVRAWELDGGLEWKLYTTLPVNSVEDARKIVECYEKRWLIEESFRITKTQGLKVESSQMETGEALQRLTALAYLAAIRTRVLKEGRDIQTPGSLKTHFSAIEIQYLQHIAPTFNGRSGHQINPHPPDSIAFATWIIGRLGGWKPGVKDRPAGVIALHKGNIRFQDQLRGFILAMKMIANKDDPFLYIP